jgi:hypothetical protein
VPNSQVYETVPGWSCEVGCGWNCSAVRIETSPRFLRITYRCSVCGGVAKRHFDLEQRGYVEGVGVEPDRSRNAGKYVGSHAFRGGDFPYEAQCEKVKRWVDHARYRMNPVEAAGARIKSVCSHLSDDELKTCFTRFFAGPPVGLAFDLFRRAYYETPEIEMY